MLHLGQLLFPWRCKEIVAYQCSFHPSTFKTYPFMLFLVRVLPSLFMGITIMQAVSGEREYTSNEVGKYFEIQPMVPCIRGILV